MYCCKRKGFTWHVAIKCHIFEKKLPSPGRSPNRWLIFPFKGIVQGQQEREGREGRRSEISRCAEERNHMAKAKHFSQICVYLKSARQLRVFGALLLLYVESQGRISTSALKAVCKFLSSSIMLLLWFVIFFFFFLKKPAFWRKLLAPFHKLHPTWPCGVMWLQMWCATPGFPPWRSLNKTNAPTCISSTCQEPVHTEALWMCDKWRGTAC